MVACPFLKQNNSKCLRNFFSYKMYNSIVSTRFRIHTLKVRRAVEQNNCNSKYVRVAFQSFLFTESRNVPLLYIRTFGIEGYDDFTTLQSNLSNSFLEYVKEFINTVTTYRDFGTSRNL